MIMGSPNLLSLMKNNQEMISNLFFLLLFGSHYVDSYESFTFVKFFINRICQICLDCLTEEKLPIQQPFLRYLLNSIDSFPNDCLILFLNKLETKLPSSPVLWSLFYNLVQNMKKKELIDDTNQQKIVSILHNVFDGNKANVNFSQIVDMFSTFVPLPNSLESLYNTLSSQVQSNNISLYSLAELYAVLSVQRSVSIDVSSFFVLFEKMIKSSTDNTNALNHMFLSNIICCLLSCVDSSDNGSFISFIKSIWPIILKNIGYYSEILNKICERVISLHLSSLQKELLAELVQTVPVNKVRVVAWLTYVGAL